MLRRSTIYCYLFKSSEMDVELYALLVCSNTHLTLSHNQFKKYPLSFKTYRFIQLSFKCLSNEKMLAFNGLLPSNNQLKTRPEVWKNNK